MTNKLVHNRPFLEINSQDPVINIMNRAYHNVNGTGKHNLDENKSQFYELSAKY